MVVVVLVAVRLAVMQQQLSLVSMAAVTGYVTLRHPLPPPPPAMFMMVKSSSEILLFFFIKLSTTVVGRNGKSELVKEMDLCIFNYHCIFLARYGKTFGDTLVIWSGCLYQESLLVVVFRMLVLVLVMVG